MPSTLKYIYILIPLLLFVQCKKTTAPATHTSKPINVPLDFTFSGNQWPYQVMIFTSNQSDTSHITWDFGDSSVSYQLKEEHIYEHEGSYTVSLSSYGTSISKTIKIGLGLKEIFSKFSSWHRDVSLQEYTGRYPYPWNTVQQQSTDVTFHLDYELNRSSASDYPYYVIVPEDTVMGNTVDATKMSLKYKTSSSMGFGDQPQTAGGSGGTSCTIDLDKNSAIVTLTVYVGSDRMLITYYSK